MSRKNRNRRSFFSSVVAVASGRRFGSRMQTRRMFLEQYEGRLMMAVAPVANPDPWYSTPLNTQLTSSTAVTANDFDADSLSLTTSVVANPTNGTLNSLNSSTGQFVYTPNTSFQGFDSFTYSLSNGSPFEQRHNSHDRCGPMTTPAGSRWRPTSWPIPAASITTQLAT